MHVGFYLLAYLIPMITVTGLVVGGAMVWLTPIIFFGLLPVLDEILPANRRNLAPQHESEVLNKSAYTVLLRLWLPIQLAVIGLAVHTATKGLLSLSEIMGVIASVGISSGAGINVAHELMHRPHRGDRALAECLMMSVSYTHFCVEHVWGHHKRVATPHDPATSRFGESVYSFLPRSIIGGFKSFLQIEKQLVLRKGITAFSLRDRRVRYTASLLVMYVGAFVLTGLVGLTVIVLQGVVAFLMLEVINYLEHYGLARKEIAAHRFEKVEPAHSWSSPHRLTGWILFGLPRHADHHARAARHYPILRHLDEAPQLPMGYASMLLVALLPPLWRRVMDPRVMAVRGITPPDEQEANSMTGIPT